MLSDMAPNLSGIESSDSARIAHLVEVSIEFCCNKHLPRQTAPSCAKSFMAAATVSWWSCSKRNFRVGQTDQAKSLTRSVVRDLPGGASGSRTVEILTTAVELENRSESRCRIPRLT